MKSIKFFFQILSAVLFILLSPADANAQDAQTRDGDRATYCFDMVPSTKSALQTNADRTCNTQKATVYCHDVTTRTNMFVTLIVQPDSDRCSSTVKVKDSTAPTDADGGGTRSRGDGADFSVRILQEQCPNGGVILSAYVPGNDFIDGNSDYDFVWKSRDGREIDADMRLDCSTPKDVTLVVTHIATDQSVTKTITQDAKTRD